MPTRAERGSTLEPGPEAPLVGTDPTALDALRRDVLETVGPQYGSGILYAVGYTEGLVAALRQLHSLGAVEPSGRSAPGSPCPLLFELEGGALPEHFWGRLQSSVEAGRTARVTETGCLVSAGFAAGWYSELLGKTVLVRERECIARGAAACRFEARPLADWTAADDPFVAELLPYLDFAGLRERACSSLMSDPGPEPADGGELAPAGFLLGGLDPMSPAVHVWGPLMILPYAGAADADRSLIAVLCDSDPGEIRSAVVDLTGARIGELALPGLMQVVRRLQSLDIECILVGLSAAQRRELDAAGPLLADALFVRDLSRAIALGFQLAQDFHAA